MGTGQDGKVGRGGPATTGARPRRGVGRTGEGGCETLRRGQDRATLLAVEGRVVHDVLVAQGDEDAEVDLRGWPVASWAR